MTPIMDRTGRAGAPLRRPADEMDEHDNQYITDRGTVVLWEQAHRCTNVDAGGRPNFDCEYCFGSGFIWIPIKNIPVFAQSMTFDRRLLPGGELFPGTMTASFRPVDIVGYMDRFTFAVEQIATHELVRRTAVVDPEVLDDRIRYANWDEIIKVRDNDRDYVLGTDFSVEGDVLTWLPGGAKPEDGAYYSLRYIVHPRYLCIDPPQPRADAKNRQTKRQTPRAVLRREDFLDVRWRA